MGHGEHDDEPLDGGHDDHDEFDDDHDEPSLGAPPSPLDRNWVHPTELAAFGSAFTPAHAPRVAQRRRQAPAWLMPAAAAVAGALVTVGVLAITGTFDRAKPATNAATPLAPGRADEAGVQRAVARIGLSVVAVAARDAAGARRGSGVVVWHSGQVLANARVVGDATEVDVVTNDGTRHTAKVVGRDPSTDLVLLSFDASDDVPAADIAENPPRAGETVWIMGAGVPGSTSPWMSSGLVSSNDAMVAVEGGPMTAGLLETDAAHGATAAGAALVDAAGDVAGIVLGRVDASPVTTYAIPIKTAIEIAEQLRTDGVVSHGWGGFDGGDGPLGPTVMTIEPESAAARADMRVGDVIMTVDGRAVDAMATVQARVRSKRPGDTMELGLRRGNERLKVQLRLAGTRP